MDKSEIFDNYQSPLYITMPKGLGLTEAKENFKKYMNDIYGVPTKMEEELYRRAITDLERSQRR